MTEWDNLEMINNLWLVEPNLAWIQAKFNNSNNNELLIALINKLICLTN